MTSKIFDNNITLFHRVIFIYITIAPFELEGHFFEYLNRDFILYKLFT